LGRSRLHPYITKKEKHEPPLRDHRVAHTSRRFCRDVGDPRTSERERPAGFVGAPLGAPLGRASPAPTTEKPSSAPWRGGVARATGFVVRIFSNECAGLRADANNSQRASLLAGEGARGARRGPHALLVVGVRGFSKRINFDAAPRRNQLDCIERSECGTMTVWDGGAEAYCPKVRAWLRSWLYFIHTSGLERQQGEPGAYG